MDIMLTPELERQVKERIASGAYRSEVEVLEAALIALDAEEQTLAAIKQGHADLEAGRYRLFEESDAAFREQHQIPRSA